MISIMTLKTNKRVGLPIPIKESIYWFGFERYDTVLYKIAILSIIPYSLRYKDGEWCINVSNS